MLILLFVEGLTDATFFYQLLKLWLTGIEERREPRPGRERMLATITGILPDGSTLQVDFRNQGGVSNILDAVRGVVASTRPTHLVVARDINTSRPQTVIQSVRDLMSSLLNAPVENILASGEKFRAQNTTTTVIPVGLQDDPDLKQLGIVSHTMEDYLIKLLLSDASLRPHLPEFRQLLLDLLAVIRGTPYRIPFNSSKELFQLIKPLIKRGFSDTGVVEGLFKDADRTILEAVISPILQRLQLATDP